MVEVFIIAQADISGDTLTSTATIDSVRLEDNGRRISCRSYSPPHDHQSAVVRIEGNLNYNHKTDKTIQGRGVGTL